ncbi:hypothetical protein SAMN04488128_105449 [Chitinophaga eiseniae]|uniref:Molybdenum ABC transporter permease n=1 Tax=Chitinophaga eiseniae TaxID=634771 RepID=A0A1T4TMM0_9BACT|nr:hypothetical protein [Chitinophaga eiseniae]SKA41469.1 hypothetical protein SAMN04488128_105449 [Chitinophaga eiseniae]
MVTTIAILLIIIGLSARWYVGRNRFNRRGPGGLQHYSSYNKALATSFFERIVKIIGTLLLLFGILLLLATWINNKAVREAQADKARSSRINSAAANKR